MIRRSLTAWLALALLPLAAAGQPAPLPPVEPEVIPLWPDGSPNNPAAGPRPTLEIYRPFTPARPADATIVIVPGGGFNVVSPFEKIMAEYCRSLGYTAIVVTYRVKPHLYPAALADTLRALHLVRQHTNDWKLPPRLALLGGSAGGYLAAFVSTRPEFYRDPHDDLAGRVSARPDRLILLYPGMFSVAPAAWCGTCQKSLDAWPDCPQCGKKLASNAFLQWLGPKAPPGLAAAVSPELHVTKDNPPAILFHAADDAVVGPENSVAFARACWAVGVPAELHVYPRGGHGRVFAYDAEVSPRWRETLRQWLALWKD